jgi:hypothetical protein
MAMVTITESADTTVNILWTTPNENGSTVTQYKIQVLAKDGFTYVESLTYCNGADSVIVANKYCDIPMSVLLASPYNLL